MRQVNPDNATGTGSEHSGIFPVSNATEPYWRSQPHAIDEHRTTRDLPSECDIAIIGAGMSGAALAYHLTKDLYPKDCPSIVLLEARQVCSGATGRNGGHVKMKTDTMLDVIKRDGLEVATEVHKLAMEQIYALKEVVEREDLYCEFELRRTYDVFLTAPEAERAKREFDDCRKAGQKWTRDVDWIGPEFAEQITSIKGSKGAFSSPACSLWPYKFVSQLLARLLDKGVLNLQTNTPVSRISTDTTADDNLIHTARGTLRARKLIFATNGYTAGISPPFADTIIPTKGTCTHLVPSHPISPHLSHTYNITYQPTHVDYLNPRPDGSIVVGGAKWTYSDDRSTYYNNHDDSTLLPQARPHFENLMQRHFRGWEHSGAVLESVWTGIMGYTADEWPHVGAVPGEEGRQWIMAGFNGGGMPLIFLTAGGVAGMVREGWGFAETGLPRVFETTGKRLGVGS